MGIEERWEIEDDPDWHLIEPKPPGRGTGRGLAALALVLLVGLGLAITLSSPATSVPDTTPQPPSAETTVRQEALALATGDRDTFLLLQDSRDIDWYDSQRDLFDSWRMPALDAEPFELIATGLLAPDQAWAEVRQLGGNGYVRETRFYRFRDGRWLRTRPNLRFWGSERRLDTVHFHVVYADGDQEIVQHALARFEAAYARLCVDLGCQIRPEYSSQYGNDPVWYSFYPIWYSPFPRVLSITLVMKPDIDRATWQVVDQGQSVTIVTPSPRVMGIVDRWLGQIDPLDPKIYDSLVRPVARVAAGGEERWTNRLDGQLFFEAVVAWERDWLRPLTPDSLRYAPPNRDFINDDIPLESLWDWPRAFLTNSRLLDRLQHQVMSAVVFLGKDYGADSTGAIGRFTRAIATSHSLPEAIEKSLGISYPEFERQWKAWLERTGS